MAFTSRSAQSARGSFCLQLTSQCSAGCVTRSLGSIRPVQSTVLHQRQSFIRAEAETLSCSLPGLHSRQSHATICPAAAAGKAGSKNDSRHSVRQPAFSARPLLSNGSSLPHSHSARRMHSAVSCLTTAESSQEAPTAHSIQPPPTYVTAKGRIIASAAPSPGLHRASHYLQDSSTFISQYVAPISYRLFACSAQQKI